MPPKKQKQTPKNGFFYFMLEFKEKQGRKFRSLAEVADTAGPHWSVSYCYCSLKIMNPNILNIPTYLKV